MVAHAYEHLNFLDFFVYLCGIAFLIIICCSALITFFTVFRQYVWARLFPVDFVKKYGGWAVVTGATDGIGKEYARQLAKRGMNVVLISRTEAKLKAVAEEISTETGKTVKYIVADFCAGKSAMSHLRAQLDEYEVGVLVNNVGFLSDYGYFGELDDHQIWNMLTVNVESVLGMTKMVITKMAARKRGAIVNLSSSAAAYPTPFLSVYSATKSFVDTFSRALSFEYSPLGVTVQSVRPFYVETPMTRNLSSRLRVLYGRFYPSAETYVQSALVTLPHASATEGYFLHWLQRGALTFCGPWLWGVGASYMNKGLMEFMSKQ